MFTRHEYICRNKAAQVAVCCSVLQCVADRCKRYWLLGMCTRHEYICSNKAAQVAVSCGVLRCVAVCLQCVANIVQCWLLGMSIGVCCSMSERVAVCCSTLQMLCSADRWECLHATSHTCRNKALELHAQVAVWYSVLQRVTAYCSVSQCVAVCSSTNLWDAYPPRVISATTRPWSFMPKLVRARGAAPSSCACTFLTCQSHTLYTLPTKQNHHPYNRYQKV